MTTQIQKLGVIRGKLGQENIFVAILGQEPFFMQELV